MTAVRWWFVAGAALHLAGAFGARELAHAAADAGRPLAAGWWTAVMYAGVAAAVLNAALLRLDDDDAEK